MQASPVLEPTGQAGRPRVRQQIEEIDAAFGLPQMQDRCSYTEHRSPGRSCESPSVATLAKSSSTWFRLRRQGRSRCRGATTSRDGIICGKSGSAACEMPERLVGYGRRCCPAPGRKSAPVVPAGRRARIQPEPSIRPGEDGGGGTRTVTIAAAYAREDRYTFDARDDAAARFRQLNPGLGVRCPRLPPAVGGANGASRR